MKILITGGTGALGREIATAAEAAGHSVRIGSRRARPATAPPAREWARMEMASGRGMAAALDGADAVIHAASDPMRARSVDVEGTRLLAEAAGSAAIRHLVYVSIVGIDRIPFSYYRHKLATERIVAASGVPFSILRATQFHTLIDMLLSAVSRVPFVIPLPADLRFQSVAPAEVAARLVRCVDAGPAGRRADFGGPEAMTLGEMAAEWKDAHGVGKRVARIPAPGALAAALRAGHNTVPAGGDHGTVRWRDWLRSR
ncbi:MAG TPA: NAD(P)H-binding protein [Longimicrobium sp.]|jgi:uncharacterized protein YbjT (DUF2867 family)